MKFKRQFTPNPMIEKQFNKIASYGGCVLTNLSDRSMESLRNAGLDLDKKADNMIQSRKLFGKNRGKIKKFLYEINRLDKQTLKELKKFGFVNETKTGYVVFRLFNNSIGDFIHYVSNYSNFNRGGKRI